MEPFARSGVKVNEVTMSTRAVIAAVLGLVAGAATLLVLGVVSGVLRLQNAMEIGAAALLFIGALVPLMASGTSPRVASGCSRRTGVPPAPRAE